MSQKIWLGGIYLKDEGGYDIVLRALGHYEKRLKKIGQSPELKDAPTFAQVVKYEASKTGPQIQKVVEKIKNALDDPSLLKDMEVEIPLIEKALVCYRSDIQKAQNGSEFYLGFIQDIEVAKSDLEEIDDALSKITKYT